MILGQIARRGRSPAGDPARSLGNGAGTHGAGPLRVAWGGDTQTAQAGDLLVLVDGFLIGPLATPQAIAAAWREQRSGLAERLRGAFTVVVWDGAHHEGLIACDHYSARTCLLHESSDGLRFGTHMPSLLRLLPADPGPEPAVIVPWIVPRYLQGRRTMARGVERLGGATLLEVDEGGWRRHRYWAPRYREPLDVPRQDLPPLVRGAVHDAVARRLPKDEPAGVILSGGLDSSIVAATAHAAAPGRVNAYSTVFPDWPPADESSRIVATTDALGLRAVRKSIRPQGALRVALEYLRDSGSVPGGPGLLVERPLLEDAAADGVGVILDGQGGDEVFGYSPYLIADCIRRGDVRRLMRLLTWIPDLGRRRPSKRALRALLVDFGLKPALGPRAPRRLRTTADLPVPDWLAPSAREVFEEAHDPWPWLREGVPRWWAYQSYLVSLSREGSALGEYTWSRGAGLGLQSRTPLFDVELTELMLSLPPEANWGRVNRPLARAAVAGMLPDSVRLNARKANIGPFYFDVLMGPDLGPIRELLLDPAARVREWAIAAELDRTVRRNPTRQDPDWLGWTTVVWRLATAECWLRWREDPAWVDEMLDRDDVPQVEATNCV